jgi:hypothetical protein
MAHRTIMNIARGHLSINLDTMGASRKRDSLGIPPRHQVEVTDEQFNSRELQKLLKAKFLVDVTAASERRRKREQELGKKPTS